MRYTEILEACWKGYRQAGMKKKGDRQVPNCVPVSENEVRNDADNFSPNDNALDRLHHEFIPTWQILNHRVLKTAYNFADDDTALEFVQAIKQMGERMDHNGVITLDNAQVTVEVTTHDVNGLTRLDFEYALKAHDLSNKMNGDQEPHPTNSLEAIEEDLKKWFKEKWVRFGPDGKIRGDCARGSSKEGKPKCLPQSKAHALGKKGRASSAAKKRREDPDPERRGPARNVATRVKEDAQGESEQQHGWRAELVDEISPITFEVRLTNRRSRESANFVVRPADLIRKGLAGKFSIDSMDIQDLQTGATRSIVTDDPAPWVYILDAVDALFYDTPALQARLEAQLKAHQDQALPMLPGLKKREHAGQGIAVKDFVQGQQAAKDAVARAQGKKELDEKQDACYHKVKSRYKVWPSAYASGALVQCRKKGAANWGNKKK